MKSSLAFSSGVNYQSGDVIRWPDDDPDLRRLLDRFLAEELFAGDALNDQLSAEFIARVRAEGRPIHDHEVNMKRERLHRKNESERWPARAADLPDAEQGAGRAAARYAPAAR